LNETRPISQVDEKNPTEISAPMHPSGQRDESISKIARQLSAGGVPVSGRAPIRRLDP
jgi:hypothetical protein